MIYGSVPTSMDPKTGSYMGGSPESTLLCAGAVEMARHIGIPNSTGGFGSGAKAPGVQASLENAVSAMTCAAVGGEVVNGFGVPDGSTLLSYEQFLIDNEIAGMVLKVFKGYPVDKDALATELVKKIGIGGSYLAQMHTIKNMREIFIPTLWDSDPFEMWVKKGAKDPMERALEKVDEILKTHKPVPLDKKVSDKLGTIVKQFK